MPRTSEGERRELVPDPSEQEVVKRICTLYREGVRVTHIARRLNRELTPARGVQWSQGTVYRVLARAGLWTVTKTGKRKTVAEATRDRALAIRHAHAHREAGAEPPSDWRRAVESEDPAHSRGDVARGERPVFY